MQAAAPVTVQRQESFFDPFSLANIQSDTPAYVQASLQTRVLTVGKYAACGGLIGGLSGGTFIFLRDLYFYLIGTNSSQSICLEDIQKGVKTGAGVGMLVGGTYSAYEDFRFHIRLRTDLKMNEPLKMIANAKANYIFKEYVSKLEEDRPELFDEYFYGDLYIYPVKAGDGVIYEHAHICRHLTENFPRALMNYEQMYQRFPNDPTVLPPLSSPCGKAGDVRINNLKLHFKTLKKISGTLAELFKELNAWGPTLQETIDQKYVEKTEVFSAEELDAVDEKILASKMCQKQPLSLKEVFIIKQLFEHYLTELKTRDDRIFKAISKVLLEQNEKGIISDKTYFEEMHKLVNWHQDAKDLYK